MHSFVTEKESQAGTTLEEIRHNWSLQEVEALFALPFNDLLFEAQTMHRRYFDPNQVQVSTLLSIKTGACPEDCAYCPQSTRYDTGLEVEKLMEIEHVLEQARAAVASGATRFCMGAAWRSPKQRDMPQVVAMVKGVRELGLESCMTLGMLTQEQAQELAEAGLDYYNHNLDTSPEYYKKIITTRTYQERLDTLKVVDAAGLNTCCGGIVGMGESRTDRINFLYTLNQLDPVPQSVPINQLVRVPGTPLADTPDLDPIEFARTIAVARIIMPNSRVRLSAGRQHMSDEMQALCFFAGANSIFYGDTLLTTENNHTQKDRALFKTLGLNTTTQDAQHATV